MAIVNLHLERVDSSPQSLEEQLPALMPACRTLDGFAAECSGAVGIDIEPCESGTSLTVRTLYSLYRIVVLDGPRHLVKVQGGKMFPEAMTMRLEGATSSGSALKMGSIIVGQKIEWSLGRQRIVSSRVLVIVVEGSPPLRRVIGATPDV